MKLIDYEITLSSSLYGDFCLIDGYNIKKYLNLDRKWIDPHSSDPDVSNLLNGVDKENSSGLWCVKIENLKKIEIINCETFLSFPNHVEQSLRESALCMFPRVKPEYNLQPFGAITYAITKYIHWELRNQPALYLYSYGDSTSMDVQYCTQQNSFVNNPLIDKNNLIPIKQYNNYNNSGKNLVLWLNNPSISYYRLVQNNFIDSDLHNSIQTYINNA